MSTSTATTAPKTAPRKASTACLCGCGETTVRTYRPGHDARHAGAVARQLVANPSMTARESKALLGALGSATLQAKAKTLAAGWLAKAAKKQAKAEATAAYKAKISKI